MVPSSAPESPAFRITFFFGPEADDRNGRQWRCVFNVKKRNWKGGIQVTVEVTAEQIKQGRAACDFATWRDRVLSAFPQEEQPVLSHRIDELFIQALCAWKLDLLTEAGLTQENQTIPAGFCADELLKADHSFRSKIIAYLCTELDLDEAVHRPR